MLINELNKIKYHFLNRMIINTESIPICGIRVKRSRKVQHWKFRTSIQRICIILRKLQLC